jgi:hypothetical protein
MTGFLVSMFVLFLASIWLVPAGTIEADVWDAWSVDRDEKAGR